MAIRNPNEPPKDPGEKLIGARCKLSLWLRRSAPPTGARGHLAEAALEPHERALPLGVAQLRRHSLATRGRWPDFLHFRVRMLHVWRSF